jgi:hypothetical protein
LENDCENANTHAHGDFHMMVLAHLRRRPCLSGRQGFGSLSLLPSLRAWDLGFFREMKYPFSIAPEVEKVVKARKCFMS